MNRVLSILLLLITLALVLSVNAGAIVRILNAATPLVIVIGVLLLAWQLVRYFTRP